MPPSLLSLATLVTDVAPTPDPPHGGSLLALLSIGVASLAGIGAVITAWATRGASASSQWQSINAVIAKERDAYLLQSAEKDRVIAAQRDRIGYLETRLWAHHIDPDPDTNTPEEPAP